MGAGNWVPRDTDGREHRHVYVDYRMEHDEDFDQSLAEEHDWDDYLQNVLGALPKTFVRDTAEPWRYGTRVVASNGLYEIGLGNQDNGMGTLLVIVREGAPAFAGSRLGDTARRIFDAVSEVYDLSVRTSAWTSVEYRPTQQV